MPTLYAVGQRYDRMITISGVTSSVDGYTWPSGKGITEPMLPRQDAVTIATDGKVIAVASDAGYISSTRDSLYWDDNGIVTADYTAGAMRYGTDSLGANAQFMTAGCQKYARDEVSHGRLDEVAQIFASPSGYDNWDMIYSHDSNSARFHGLRNINGTWIALGQADGNPLLVYSTNSGATWTQVSLPTVFNGIPLYDITYISGNYQINAVTYPNVYYISAQGMVIYTPSLTTPVWDATDTVTTVTAQVDFKQIASNPSGHVVAVSSGMIYYTTDGVAWSKFTYPGYQFISVVWFNDHWLVGCRTLLTRYTYFTSTDTIFWHGANSGVQMSDFAII
jgi:hypothetical protein